MQQNYFIYTLGQARNHPKTSASTISDFLEQQAAQCGQRPAVGFAGLAEKPTCVLTFHELNEQTKDAARNLVSLVPELKGQLGQGRTVALLAHSNIIFLEAWLGLIRLGFSVLLLAPQLDRSSIEHLCGGCDVKHLFHDNDHTDRVKELNGVMLVRLESSETTRGGKHDPEIAHQLGPRGKCAFIPYLHHSSGTSSGKPKAIPQTNAAAFAALSSIDTSPGAATFSSTPLYHGGVADCFRAWTSGQMIWLFPGGEKPITAQNILNCLSVAEKRATDGSTTPVKYFSSVPYVLRDLASSDEGLSILRRMDIVGVGGAAFPTTLGQKLAIDGVNLVSRYGSAECGFLLSSFRDFEKDEEWDYLRSNTGAEHLSFEPQESGLFELVVQPGWPHMAKTNRENGSYATADLFEKHSTKLNAWRYHSRADAQITLVNGKKFDPEPIESAIVSTSLSKIVLDILVFGNGESYPGALIFVRKDSGSSLADLMNDVWPVVDQVNQENPSHARFSKAMIRFIIHEDESVPPLEKSSKGTILRGKAHERYHDQIRQVYEGESMDSDEYSINTKSDLVAAITHAVERTTSKNLSPDDDFFEHGIDSVACIQIMKAIQHLVTSLRERFKADTKECEQIGRKEPSYLATSPCFQDDSELRNNLLYDCGTIQMVATFLLGESYKGADNDLCSMKETATKFDEFGVPEVSQDSSTKKDTKKKGLVVLLTGATGALGTHLLEVLRSRSNVQRVYCLVRASDADAASHRTDDALKSKAMDGLPTSSASDKKIICIPCNLVDASLGMDSSMMQNIRSTVDMIVHAAWAVNFTLRLKSFDSNLAGLQNLLNLGLAAAETTCSPLLEGYSKKRRVKFQFCSSIASVSSSSSSSIAEQISDEPSDASPIGYSRSKWVAESICVKAHTFAQEACIPLDIEILRIGQLCGDTKYGIWNKTEAWPLMLSTFDVVGCLPDLSHEQINWLPLDTAACAIGEVAFRKGPEDVSEAAPIVYHIVNPHSKPSWRQMLHWLQEKEGDRLQIVAPATWLQLIEDRLASDYPDHPSRKLLSLWKDAYLLRGENVDRKAEFVTTRAASVSHTMKCVTPVSRDLVEKMWDWIRRSIRPDGAGVASQS